MHYENEADYKATRAYAEKLRCTNEPLVCGKCHRLIGDGKGHFIPAGGGQVLCGDCFGNGLITAVEEMGRVFGRIKGNAPKQGVCATPGRCFVRFRGC